MIKEEADDNFYTLVILGDHGNADQMLDEKGNPNKTHTTSDVPFIITDEKVTLEETGTIAQVAPTILKYMDIAIPKEMQESGVIIK
jgi:2,3-bisphosphoglycerate-independent phosphoglycerate mutase